MNGEDRAVEVLAATVNNDRQGLQEWHEFAEALAAAGLLVTDEIQAVLDSLNDLGVPGGSRQFYAAVDAYFASRGGP